MRSIPALSLTLLLAAAAFAQGGDASLTPYRAKTWSATFRMGSDSGGDSPTELSPEKVDRGDGDDSVKTYRVQSYIYVDADNQYTESVSYTDYAEPVPADELGAALEKAVAAFAHPSYQPRVSNRRGITVDGQPGLAATANDDYAKNAYFEIFAVGKRLYQLAVVTDAVEEADDGSHAHKIEAERFFKSFKLEGKARRPPAQPGGAPPPHPAP